jgi:hypothetical protein
MLSSQYEAHDPEVPVDDGADELLVAFDGNGNGAMLGLLIIGRGVVVIWRTDEITELASADSDLEEACTV